MAKRRKSRRRGLGSTLVVRRGLGANVFKGNGLAAQLLPPAIGGGVALATLFGIRHFAKPENGDQTHLMLFKHAPLFALGAGGAASAALYMLGGTKPAATAGVAAAGVVAAGLLSDMFLKNRASAYTASLAGLGAIVPEYAGMQGVNGLGAVVMSPQLSGPRGEEVRLGAINPASFGTPGFNP